MFTKVFLEEFTINPPAFDGQSALAENQDGHLEALETLGINSREPYTGINTKIKGNPTFHQPPGSTEFIFQGVLIIPGYALEVHPPHPIFMSHWSLFP
jgi:hypothetical protein